MTPEERAQAYAGWMEDAADVWLTRGDLEKLSAAIRSAEREAKNAALEEAAKVCDAMDEECEARASASNGAGPAAGEYRAEAWAHHKAAKRIRSLKEIP